MKDVNDEVACDDLSYTTWDASAGQGECYVTTATDVTKCNTYLKWSTPNGAEYCYAPSYNSNATCTGAGYTWMKAGSDVWCEDTSLDSEYECVSHVKWFRNLFRLEFKTLTGSGNIDSLAQPGLPHSSTTTGHTRPTFWSDTLTPAELQTQINAFMTTYLGNFYSPKADADIVTVTKVANTFTIKFDKPYFYPESLEKTSKFHFGPCQGVGDIYLKSYRGQVDGGSTDGKYTAFGKGPFPSSGDIISKVNGQDGYTYEIETMDTIQGVSRIGGAFRL